LNALRRSVFTDHNSQQSAEGRSCFIREGQLAFYSFGKDNLLFIPALNWNILSQQVPAKYVF